jgi:hypothetical protein
MCYQLLFLALCEVFVFLRCGWKINKHLLKKEKKKKKGDEDKTLHGHSSWRLPSLNFLRGGFSLSLLLLANCIGWKKITAEKLNTTDFYKPFQNKRTWLCLSFLLTIESSAYVKLRYVM